MPQIPGSSVEAPYGTEDKAIDNFKRQISPSISEQIIYTRTSGAQGQSRPVATVKSFLQENGTSPMDVLGFVGHASLAASTETGSLIAVGLVFVDNDLIRTPDCTPNGNLLGVCYYLDQRQTEGPPCLAGAVPIASYDGTTIGCYLLPARLDGSIALTAQVLLTSAKVVFVAACDTSSTFTNWWDLNLNAPTGGRAIVVPDIAAMSAMQINQGLNISVSSIDIQQGAVGWVRLVNSLAAGKTVAQAVDDANQAIDAFYQTLVWPPDFPRLAQVKFRVIGNRNVCTNCKTH